MNNVLIIADIFYPEPIKYNPWIKNRLLATGDLYNVIVLSPTDCPPRSRLWGLELINGYRVIWINKAKFRFIRANYILLSFIIAFRFLKVCKKFNPDLVHCHFAQNYSWVSLLLKKSKEVFITEHHTGISEVYKRRWISPLYYLLKFCYKNAQKVLSVGEQLQKDIVKYYGVQSVLTINPIDIAEFDAVPRTIEKNIFNLIIGGHNYLPYDKKGFLLAVKALERLIDKSSFKYQLILFGDGNYENQLKHKIPTKVLRHIKFCGIISRPELASLFYQSHVYLSLSKKETFGVVVVEAMLSGLPCVILPSGGPEQFSKSFNSIQLKTPDIDEISSAINTIAINYEKYDSKEISEYISSNYSYNAFKKRISHLYNC